MDSDDDELQILEQLRLQREQLMQMSWVVSETSGQA